MQQVVSQLCEHLDENNPGGVLGFYLTGSAAMAGLRPDSDIDLVLVTQRSLSRAERRALLTLLLKISGASGGLARPVELTCVALPDVVPWAYPPTCDLLYGEWLRPAFAGGAIPEPHLSSDLAVMLTALHRHFRVLRGSVPSEIIDPVPDADVRQAILDSLPSLLTDLVGDERNVLLTLARMLVTISTGQIVSKDEAARRVESVLPEPARSILNEAAESYLGLVHGDWSAQQPQVQQTAAHLVALIQTRACDSR